MRGWLTWIAVGAAGACYSPRPSGDCEVLCSPAAGDGCPAGLTCGASGLCSVGGHACAGDVDAGIDGPAICFGTGIAKPCVPAVPPGSSMLSGVINTDTDTRCVRVDQPARGPSLCVIAGEQIVIGGPVRAIGARPLVLVASRTITVSAMLDARSVRGDAFSGAGASSCQTPSGLSEGGVGGGGAGGSFQGSGGAGGASSTVPATTPAAPVAFPDHVRGGCPGGGGGEGTGSMLSKAGAGGGALYLIANERIDVQSVIAANGAGGFLEPPDAGARPGAGGGGGGSGGLIVLEAPVITLGGAARLLAVGGGGSGGGGIVTSKAGGDPDPDGSTAASITAAGGAGGATNGGKGGDGSSMTARDGAAGLDGTIEGGGGGGGGGSGFIKLICATCSTAAALVIPPASP